MCQLGWLVGASVEERGTISSVLILKKKNETLSFIVVGFFGNKRKHSLYRPVCFLLFNNSMAFNKAFGPLQSGRGSKRDSFGPHSCDRMPFSSSDF